MSRPILPLNPCLIGIVLIIKNSDGPRYVFHYPPEPGKDKPRARLDYEHSSEEEESSSDEADDGYSSLEEDFDRGIPSPEDGARQRWREPDIEESGSPEKDGGNVWNRPVPGETGLFGLPYGIKDFLSPPPIAHKKKFEISIDGLTFLGRPVFSDDNGEWKRKRRKKPVRDSDGSKGTRSGQVKLEENVEEEEVEHLKSTDNQGIAKQDYAVDNTPALQAEDPEPNLHNDHRAAEQRPRDRLFMFNVAFVMQPPPLEHQQRIDEMYDNVVKDFSKALKREQVRSNYVLVEAEKMRECETEKDHAVHEKTQRSPLARAIASLYTSISTSRIAHLSLTPTQPLSLQIPLPTSISVLPLPTSPQFPGLWLTTAIAHPSQPNNPDDSLDPSTPAPRAQLASHFALLLLADLSSILADIDAASSPLAGPLTRYLSLSTPRKSFLQIAQSSGMALPEILFLASHLVYWRRARAIPPLHQRDTYIVSPNADMRKLKPACASYAKLFPSLPSLPKMLHALSWGGGGGGKGGGSGGPRSFGTLIPSRDHKGAYLDILAWLMRGGWVTQLRTFAWLKVSGGVQEAVRREIEGEENGDGGNEAREAGENRRGSVARSAELTVAKSDASGLATLPSLRSDLPALSTSPPSSIHSQSTTSTAIPAPRSPLPAPIFILNPTRPSGLESRHIAHIANDIYRSTLAFELARRRAPPGSDPHGHSPEKTQFPASFNSQSSSTSYPSTSSQSQDQDQDQVAPSASDDASPFEETDSPHYAEAHATALDAKQKFMKCLPYFNGRHALEKIPVREGWKRKRVAELVAVWEKGWEGREENGEGEGGCLVVGRHW